jgi:mannose-6-phosphate isomerase-like protein (cupin superfamily)
MSEYAVKKIDEMEAVYLGAFKRARAELGVESFGMAIIDLPPSFENYPEHDHAQDGQEEVFVALRGAGEIEIAGERFPFDPDHVARVAAGVKRKIWPGPDGVRVLALGGTPGKLYEAPDSSKLGEPDPMAR